MALDLRRLHYFRTIAARGSLSAAARLLNVAQPALTHHISEMEQSLGVPLFHRSTRGVTLTAEGRRLLQHADAILDQVAFAEAEMRRAAAHARTPRTTAIAVTPSLTSIAPALMRRMAHLMPDVTLRIAGATDRAAASMLETGQIDVVLQFADWSKSGTPLVWDSVVLVSSPAKRMRDTIHFRDLAAEPLLLPFVDSPLRRRVEDIAAQAGIRLNVVAEIEGTGSRKEAVLGGLGSTLGSWHSVARECDAGWLQARTIVDPPIRRLFVLRHRDGVDPAITAALQAEITELLLGKYSQPAADHVWSPEAGSDVDHRTTDFEAI